MKLSDLISKLKMFRKNAEEQLANSLKSNEQEIENMQRERLSKGLDAEGDPLVFLNPRKSKVGKAYTIPYERIKRKKGGKVNKVDLNLSGELYDSIHAKARKNILDINFDDPNKGKLKGIKNNYKEPLGFDDRQEVEISQDIAKDLEMWAKGYFA